MAEIGKINRLIIQRTLSYGAQLDGGELGHITLAKRDIPKNCRPGDEVEVFVYEDKDKHLLATTTLPYATVGQFARLRVAANSPAGAYLDWGMQKDLLVPNG
jgi:predicted RNA-binding protein (virulence factor B family)